MLPVTPQTLSRKVSSSSTIVAQSLGDTTGPLGSRDSATVGTEVNGRRVGANVGCSLFDDCNRLGDSRMWGSGRGATRKVGGLAHIVFLLASTDPIVESIQTGDKPLEGLFWGTILMHECILDLPIQSSLKGMVLGLVVVLKDRDQALKIGVVLAKLAIVLPNCFQLAYGGFNLIGVSKGDAKDLNKPFQRGEVDLVVMQVRLHRLVCWSAEKTKRIPELVLSIMELVGVSCNLQPQLGDERPEVVTCSVERVGVGNVSWLDTVVGGSLQFGKARGYEALFHQQPLQFRGTGLVCLNLV